MLRHRLPHLVPLDLRPEHYLDPCRRGHDRAWWDARLGRTDDHGAPVGETLFLAHGESRDAPVAHDDGSDAVLDKSGDTLRTRSLPKRGLRL